MSKANVLYIEQSKFLAVLADLKVPHTVQSGYIRVEGPKGRRLYVAATKKVGRVDISGFEVEFGAKVPHCGVFGRVKQQLDLDPVIGEEGILENFKCLVQHMLSLEAEVKVPKAPKEKVEGQAKAPKAKATKAPGTPGGGDSVVTPEMIAEAKAARMLLIAKVAAEKGVQVSASASEE